MSYVGIFNSFNNYIGPGFGGFCRPCVPVAPMPIGPIFGYRPPILMGGICAPASMFGCCGPNPWALGAGIGLGLGVGMAMPAIFKGIGVVGKGIWNGLKWAGKGIWNGMKWLGNGIWNGLKWVGNGIAKAAKWVWNGITGLFK